MSGDEDTVYRFEKLLKNLDDLQGIEIPGRILSDVDTLNSISLHVFCDASKLAYTTLIYVRSETSKKEDNRNVFFGNCVREREIQLLSDPVIWNFLSGIINPAYLSWCVCNAKTLAKSHWWEDLVVKKSY
ncbi:hypothetical protein TNCV_2488501 [Trichonephila clavipes]|nr:hypothetical protein TNCV_2488501 [Trichonephila clavipes]